MRQPASALALSAPACRPRASVAALHAILVAGSLGLLCAPMSAQAQPAAAAAASAQRSYAIPAGPLNMALANFGAQAQITLVGTAQLVEGKQTAGLQGSYTVAAGFVQLLQGSGLQAFVRGDGSYGLRAAPSAEPGAAGAAPDAHASLPHVNVTAAAFYDPITEGTGSYTAMGPSSNATRLELSPQQTPQATSLITRQQMEDYGLHDMDRVLAFTPGVSIETAAVGGGYQFASRGFNITGMQVDGLQGSYREAGRGAFNASVLDSALYDRVEVVRGATGLVTGSGEPSASINLVRKRPTRAFAGSVSATVGSWSHRRTITDLSGPLAQDGRVRGRLIAATRDGDSFRDRRSEQMRTLSGMVEVDLTPVTLLTIGHDLQSTQLNGESNSGVPLFNSAGQRIDVARSTSVAPHWTYWDKRYANTFVYLQHEFDSGWKAKLAYGHQRNAGDVLLSASVNPNYMNADGSGQQVRANLAADGVRYQDNLEVYANGPFSLLGRRHQLALGASASRGHDDSKTLTIANAGLTTIPDLFSWDGQSTRPTVAWDGSASQVNTRQSGMYASARLSLADPLNLVLGARLSNYRRSTDNYGTGGLYTGTTAGASNHQVLTPYAGITYDVTPQWTAYTSYAEIFKPQSYRDKNGKDIAPVTGRSVELGVKGALFDERLNVSAAVYETRQDNLAERAVDASGNDIVLPDGSYAYASTGKGNVSRGFEIEFAGDIGRQWQVFGSFTRNNTRNAAGETMYLYMPRDQAKLGATYRFAGTLQGLSLGATLGWVDRRAMRTASAAIPTITIPGVGNVSATHGSYTVVDLHASWRIDRHWQASLNIGNLFDKHYYDNFVVYRAQYGAPRNAQATLRYQW